MPRSSFALEDSLVPENLRLLSHSATAIFNLLVSSLRASFAPDCNLGSYHVSEDTERDDRKDTPEHRS
jgi:hypothetical protein